MVGLAYAPRFRDKKAYDCNGKIGEAMEKERSLARRRVAEYR